MEIYCGNNELYPGLANDSHTIGTRYECLKKGVGIGLNLKKSIDVKYSPIDERKIYCGNKNNLPTGYDYMGNGPLCMQKGAGIGMSLQRSHSKKGVTFGFVGPRPIKRIVANICAIILFIILIKVKPKIIQRNPDNGEKKSLSWYKTLIMFFIIMAVFNIIVTFM